MSIIPVPKTLARTVRLLYKQRTGSKASHLAVVRLGAELKLFTPSGNLLEVYVLQEAAGPHERWVSPYSGLTFAWDKE